MASSRSPFARRAWAGRVILASVFLLACFASSARADTVVSLTFDDGIASQLDAASMLEAHSMRGTFFINSGNIASKAYFMTWSQLDGVAAAGHEIAGHTVDHKRLTDLTADQQRHEICDDAATLRGHDIRSPTSRTRSARAAPSQVCSLHSTTAATCQRERSVSSAPIRAAGQPARPRRRCSAPIPTR
jgi:peptidoglycan/xylan/chitin deacetylase (PgdA/CDA1 family)